MGFTCKKVRHKSGRNRDQDAVSHCCHRAQSIVDCSSNPRKSRKFDRHKCDVNDRHAVKTTAATSTTTTTSTIYEQLSLIRTTVNLVPTTHQDERDDIRTSFATMDEDDEDDDDDDGDVKVNAESMVEYNKIEKSISSNRNESLRRTSALNQLKRGFYSSVAALRIRMSAPKRKAKAKTPIVYHCEFEIMSKLLAIFAAPFWFAGTNTYSRFTHMVNFERKNSNNHHHHSIFTLSPTHTELETIAPTKIHTPNNNNNENQNKIEYECRSRSNNNNNNNSSRGSRSKYRISSACGSSDKSDMVKTIYKSHDNRSIITSSQYFIRQSVCLYAASGFLIALCFMAVPAAASIESLHPM